MPNHAVASFHRHAGSATGLQLHIAGMAQQHDTEGWVAPVAVFIVVA
jgi:hypothetical protein